MEPINVLGKGFIGSRFCEIYKNVIVNNRNDYEIKSKNILYLISTVDNYNVYSDPFLDISTNLTTLIKTLESCKGKDIVFNFISSWFVYGDVEIPAKEESFCNPKGFYSITKRTAEQLLISYCDTFNIKYRIIRLANVLGEKDKKVSSKKNAIQYLIGKIKNNEDISLYDGGNIYRDYIYVDDVVSAISIILEKGNINEIYNVGNGEKIFIKDILEYAVLKAKSKTEFKTIQPSDFHSIVQVKNMVLDVSKIKKLGYKKTYEIFKIVDIILGNI